MQTNAVREKKITKTNIAKKLGISRGMLYYQHKRPIIDEEVRHQIEAVLAEHKAYGHKRIAPELKLNKKRILRVMKKFNIKPYRMRTKKPDKKTDEGKAAENEINVYKLLCPIVPNIIWVSDFTYIKFQGYFIYLATIIDVYTREIVGWNISNFHDTNLILGALKHAIKRTGKTPIYLHSDQGSEYDSRRYEEYTKRIGILISMSAKSSPWENGFQESFYSQFKVDLGYVSRFETVEELIEAIYQTIYYYNNQRIHTKLKMAPVSFRYIYEDRLLRQTV